MGHRGVCVTLPGLAPGDDPSGHRLKDAEDHLVRVIGRESGPVSLVGHSWAGYPIVGALPRSSTVTEVVFVNAQIPVPGKSLLDDNPVANAELLRGAIQESEHGAIPPLIEYVEQLFLQDAAPALQRFVADLLTPQPGRYFSDTFEGSGAVALGVPCRYLLSEHDRALQWPGECFAARLGTDPVSVPGTHDSLLTHPDELARAILAG